MRKWDIRSVKRCSFIKTSRSEREKQTSYINTYTQNLEKETDEPVCRRGRETLDPRFHETATRLNVGHPINLNFRSTIIFF